MQQHFQRPELWGDKWTLKISGYQFVGKAKKI